MGERAGATAPLVDHLRELRRRVAVSILGILVGAVVSFLNADALISLLRSPLGDAKLYFIGVGDAFGVRMQLSLIGGVAIAMPLVLWQAWAFVSPGLTTEERRAARPWLPLALLLFCIGVAVAWVVLPFAIGFLLSFASADLVAMIAADRYFAFVGSLILVFGLAAEYPILLAFLARVGIISSKKLRAWRRGALVGIVIVSAVATPGTDLVSPIVLAVVLAALYELSILLIRVGGR